MSGPIFRQLRVEPFEGRLVPSGVPAQPPVPGTLAEVFSSVAARLDAGAVPVPPAGADSDPRVDLRESWADRPGGGDALRPPDPKTVLASLGPAGLMFAYAVRDQILSGNTPPEPDRNWSGPWEVATDRLRLALMAIGSRTAWEPPTALPPANAASPPAPTAGPGMPANPDVPRSDGRDHASQVVGPGAAAGFAPANPDHPPVPGESEEAPATDSPQAFEPVAPAPEATDVWETVADQLTFLGAPLAGAWPFDAAAVAGGAAELLGHLTDLGTDLPAEVFGDDASAWLGGVALTAGAVGYGVFLRPPRPRAAAGRPGFDSVLARGNDFHDAPPG